MAKAKPKSTLMVADGAGELVPLVDRRFEAASWPICLDVPKERADTWLQYLSAECGRRGWSSGGIVQLEARENSGSITIHTGGAGQPQVAVVWERKPGGPLKVRCRSIGMPELPLPQLHELFKLVNQSSEAGITERVYRRGQLAFNGLAWRGEFWLDDTLRLGPAAQQYETALIGPRVILVDALVECIGASDAPLAFDQKLRELSAFLSVVTGTNVHLPVQGRAWTFTNGASDCAVRSLGYFQADNPQEMPGRGTAHAVPMKPVTRPDFSHRGIDGSTNEQELPADIADLWASYCALTTEQRRQFLQVAAKWQQALSHWGDQMTLNFALMVVACEALKPAEPQFRDHNIYHVVEALLGKPSAEKFQEHWFRPQDIRNAHLHRGEFRGAEFVRQMVMSSYRDPTFDQACREMAMMTQAAIIEWLRLGGSFTMPVIKRRKTLRRWVKDNAIGVLVVSTLGALSMGLVLGWVLRPFWRG
jgi:hypothetical protein